LWREGWHALLDYFFCGVFFSVLALSFKQSIQKNFKQKEMIDAH